MRLTPAARLASALVLGSILLGAAPAAAANPCVAAASNAQDLRAAGKLREARGALAICSRPTCNSVVRADCEKWLRELDEQQPSVVVRAVDSRGHEISGVRGALDDVAIELDGTPVPVDPGPHIVRVRSRSGDVAEQHTTVVLGEKSRVIEVRFDAALAEDGSRSPEPAPTESPPAPRAPPSTPPTTTPVVPLALAGVGGAAFVIFGVFELIGQASYADLESGCAVKHSCTASDVDPVKSHFVVAAVALGVSVVAFGAAALVYVGSRPDASSPKPRSAVHLEPRGLVF